ncbi:hypothetical protein FVE67_04440 [Thermosulfurimonas marina]|uniref:Uncharacterized protein n=2 Tax=Thermosulfurimonas marina TaxID=2047767 RepID=A0A6H1WSF4_9BACT|nr:hypothetical protein FVE67_04440 [Thermosulfurimonas marina]
MKEKELRKLLAGLSLSALLAGGGLAAAPVLAQSG